MKLYYSPGACSLSPHIVLTESGLPYTVERVDLGAKKTEHGDDYWKINPKGYVPVLELDDGQFLTEGPAIVQYLADQVPEKALAPAAGTFERYRLQEWLNYISTELHKSFWPLFGNQATDDWKAVMRDRLGKRIRVVADSLEGKRYLMGETFTVADAYLYTVLRWTRHTHIELAPWPPLPAYMDRVEARSAVKTTLAAEGLA